MEGGEGRGRRGKRGDKRGENRVERKGWLTLQYLTLPHPLFVSLPCTSTYPGGGFGEDLSSAVQQFSHHLHEFLELTTLALLQDGREREEEWEEAREEGREECNSLEIHAATFKHNTMQWRYLPRSLE